MTLTSVSPGVVYDTEHLKSVDILTQYWLCIAPGLAGRVERVAPSALWIKPKEAREYIEGPSKSDERYA